MAEAKSIIAEISGLPTLPTVVAKVNQLVASESTSASDINEVISSDMALSSKLLKVVNSPFYGFPKRINSITHAVVILGFNTLRNLALSAFAFSAFKNRESFFDHQAFWVHSLAVAVAASSLAERLEMSQRECEDAFMAGLLHDIGKAVMCEFLPVDTNTIVSHAKENGKLFLESEEILGKCPHSEIGGELLRKWNLPDSLAVQVTCHHTPLDAGDNSRGASVVHVADIIARSLCLGWGGDERIPLINTAAFETLSMDPDDLGKIMDRTLVDMRHTASFMDAIS